MEKENVAKIIFETLSEILENPPPSISANETFDELEINSIVFIRLVVSSENQFGISFEDDMLLLSKYETIQEFIDYVEKRIITNLNNEVS